MFRYSGDEHIWLLNDYLQTPLFKNMPIRLSVKERY